MLDKTSKSITGIFIHGMISNNDFMQEGKAMELKEVYKRVYGEYPTSRTQRISAILSLVKPASSPIVTSIHDISETIRDEARRRGIMESMLDVAVDNVGYLLIDNERVLSLAIIGNGREVENNPLAYYAEGRILARQERGGSYD